MDPPDIPTELRFLSDCLVAISNQEYGTALGTAKVGLENLLESEPSINTTAWFCIRLGHVIEGTWYLGNGDRFDSAKLKGYPPGSFIVIPAGVPHFVAIKDGPVIVQVSGTGKGRTEYLEK
jgi:hypothetical protein